MRISSRCEYGLRAMVFLAAREDRRPVPLPEIAAGEGIPGPFLERILARLRESGLVKATRGVSGGCERAESCASRVVWRRLDSAISGALNSITLEDLTREDVPR
jgi:Rrf2 family cysteine metabolism transcriptional repressor